MSQFWASGVVSLGGFAIIGFALARLRLVNEHTRNVAGAAANGDKQLAARLFAANINRLGWIVAIMIAGVGILLIGEALRG